jgi:hypothetical protein
MELTWILSKRKKIFENKIIFILKVFEGKKYIRSIPSAENPEKLAQLVSESELKINWNDKITTYPTSKIIPVRGYIEMRASDEEIIRFYKKYWELVDGEIEREK